MPNFYSPKQVATKTTLSLPTIWRMRRRGEFPDPVRLTPQRVAYPADVIDSWIASRMEGYPHAA